MKYLIPIAMILFLASCQKSRCWKGHGEEVTERRELGSFNILELSDQIDVVLHQDTANYLTLSAGANMVDHIETEVRNGTLWISDDNSCDFLRDYGRIPVVHLHVAELGNIFYRGHGSVTCATPLAQDSMRVEVLDGTGTIVLDLEVNRCLAKIITGPGDVELKGSADFFYIFARGNGFIQAEEFAASECFTDCGGTGDIRVQVNDIFDVKINGTGSVYWKGTGTVRLSELTGNGQLIRL